MNEQKWFDTHPMAADARFFVLCRSVFPTARRQTMRHHLCQFILAIILIAGAFDVSAKEDLTQVVDVPMSAAKADYYPWVTFLSEGPIDWFSNDESAPVQGRAYRLVITTSEIYNTVYIEMVTFGGEGCCKKLKSVRKFDIAYFCKTFNFIGEQTGFELGPVNT
jgi:hypothetical protein